MQVVDPETGELTEVGVQVVEPAPSVNTVLNLMRTIEQQLANEATPLESIPEAFGKFQADVKALYAWMKRCESVVLARMLARQAKKIGAKGEPSMSVKTDTEWTFDEAQLKRLLDVIDQPDGVTAAEYELAIRYKFTPSKTVLNELCKRGGRVAEIINLGVRGTPKHSLKIEGLQR